MISLTCYVEFNKDLFSVVQSPFPSTIWAILTSIPNSKIWHQCLSVLAVDHVSIQKKWDETGIKCIQQLEDFIKENMSLHTNTKQKNPTLKPTYFLLYATDSGEHLEYPSLGLANQMKT